MAFLALDFETADYGRDSACALGLARVEDSSIVAQRSFLIRPPRRNIIFTYIHGITWEHVRYAPTFGQLWPEITKMMAGVDFLVAHNATFDKGVMYACCDAAGIAAPTLPFQCTMRLSRRLWGIHPTRLPDVCRHFGIALNHHDALSDTLACARIMVEALRRTGGLGEGETGITFKERGCRTG